MPSWTTSPRQCSATLGHVDYPLAESTLPGFTRRASRRACLGLLAVTASPPVAACSAPPSEPQLHFDFLYFAHLSEWTRLTIMMTSMALYNTHKVG
ncbi:hypothetical protein MTO96_046838 [Rhipicephalus appendiculatus]